MKKNYTSIKLALIAVSGLALSINVSAQRIAGGGIQSLIVCSTGTGMAAGLNGNGEVGDGTTTERNSPVSISGLTGIIAVSGSRGSFSFAHSLALTSDGTAWAWGYNSFGELGDNTNTNRTVPVSVTTGVTSIAAGDSHSLFLKTDSTVWACGYAGQGQLGQGNTSNLKVPTKVSGLSGVIAIAAAYEVSYALKKDGTVWSWGNNQNGELGDSTKTEKHTPVKVKGLSGVIAIAAGGTNGYGTFALALKSDGTVWAWGTNGLGQLCTGNTTPSLIPVQCTSLTNVTAIAAGIDHGMALKNDGTVYTWGYGLYGELGNGALSFSAVTTPGKINLTGIIAIAGGERFGLAEKNDGTLWAWGRNDYGQLGDGTTTQRLSPVQITGACQMALGIKEASEKIAVSVYPNPANDQLTIEVEKYMNTTAEIFNLQGQLMQSARLQDSKTILAVNNLANGMYVVKVSNAEGVSTQKFVKE